MFVENYQLKVFHLNNCHPRVHESSDTNNGAAHATWEQWQSQKIGVKGVFFFNE
jgi:hypothetical protein